MSIERTPEDHERFHEDMKRIELSLRERKKREERERKKTRARILRRLKASGLYPELGK